MATRRLSPHARLASLAAPFDALLKERQAVGCVVSATRRSSGVAPRACVRVYARVLVPPNLYIHAYIHWKS